jgi:cytochrome c553
MSLRSLHILVIGMATILTTPAQAQDDQYAGIRYMIEKCDDCHGKNGASTDDAFPIIGGQQLHYSYVQLKDFKARRRDHEIMSPIAAELEKNQMLLLAQYYSEQEWPNIGYRPEPSQAARGRTAGDSGQCVACHLGNYEGNSRIPRLAGQHPIYLDKTMQDFKKKVRNNAAAMSSLMAAFSDEDISAMAEFFGGF